MRHWTRRVGACETGAALVPDRFCWGAAPRIGSVPEYIATHTAIAALLSEVSEVLTNFAVVRERTYALRLSCERHNLASTNWLWVVVARSFLG